MINKFLLMIFLMIFIIESYSQKATFKYWTELCTCEGTFDSTKYTRQQLQNTFDYLWWSPYIYTDGTARTLDKINDLSIENLKKECSEKLFILNSSDFVKSKFWTQLRYDRIKEIESTCKLREYTILGYSNPDTLMHYDLVDSNSIYYRNLLIKGGQDLIDAWFKYNEEWKKKNGYVERNQKKFESEYNSSQRADYARLELMMYGWWNSANHIIFHVNTTYNYGDEFEKLFIKTKCECDEP